MTNPDPRYPVQIQEMWIALKTEVIWLHGRWINYRQLFGTDPQRVDILNRTAGTFFRVIQDMMLYDVQLSLSKLGDPAKSRSKKNLTLAGLAAELEILGEVALCSKIEPLITVFNLACTKLRHRRNKRIAHFDLATMLSASVKPLDQPSRSEIETSLTALRDVMNCIELHYVASQTGYEHFIMSADGEHLIRVLKKGLRYEELVEENKIAHDDLRTNFK